MSNRNGIFDKLFLKSLTNTGISGQTFFVIYEFETQLERYPGVNAYFVCYLPSDVAAEIDAVSHGLRGGFGSVRVRVTLDSYVWSTSIFRDAKRSSYLLLIKKNVRERFKLEHDSRLNLALELVDF